MPLVARSAVAWALLLLAGCRSSEQEPKIAPEDDAAIWKLVLSQRIETHLRLLVVNRTIERSILGRDINRSDGLRLLEKKESRRPADERVERKILELLFDRMLANIRRPKEIGRGALVESAPRLATEQQIQKIKDGMKGCADCGWNKLGKGFEGFNGVTWLSRVGYAGSLAMVYVEMLCGEACGDGDLFLVENVGGIWRIRQRVGLWVS